MKYVKHDSEGKCVGFAEIPDHDTSFILDDSYKPVNESITDLNSIIVKDGQVHHKKSFATSFSKKRIAANHSDSTVITGLPEKTLVRIEDHGVYFVDDGKIAITASEPKAYKVQVDPFPFKPFEVTIDAD